AVALGADGGERVLRTVGSPACVAKNRYSLPAELPLSWSAIMQAMNTNRDSSAPDLRLVGDTQDANSKENSNG
ncbi:MAG: hypothetical protein ACOCXY_03145, partial [Planctomycetota bacterium]